MRDARKPDFGHAGTIELRIAITNSLRSPHTEKLAFPPDPHRFLLEARLLLHELLSRPKIEFFNGIHPQRRFGLVQKSRILHDTESDLIAMT